MQDARSIGHGVIRRDGPIGFQLERQLVIIENLTFAGRLDLVGDLFDGREDRVDRHQADGRILGTVLVGRDIAFAGVDRQFHVEIGTIVEVADHVILVQDLDTGAFRDVTGGDDLGAFGRDGHTLGPVDIHADRDALEVQDDVGNVFADTRNRRKLVQHTVDLDGGDGRALKRAHQHAPQRVAEREAEAALEWFGNDRRLACGVSPGLNDQLGWLDQLLPIFMDHASPPFLHRADPAPARSRIKMTSAGHAERVARRCFVSAQTRRRLGGRQPLWAIGVTSRMDVI